MMGYKNVCLTCRKAFNQGSDFEKIREAVCPECGKQMIQVDHKFKPPRKNAFKKWEVVELLLNNGFVYQRIYETKFQSPYIQYPENLKQAKEFILKYSAQSLNKLCAQKSKLYDDGKS